MTSTEPVVVHLTPGEWSTVKELLETGKGNHVIARRLFRSIETVKTQLRTACKKVGAESRTHLVVKMYRREVTVRVICPRTKRELDLVTLKPIRTDDTLTHEQIE